MPGNISVRSAPAASVPGLPVQMWVVVRRVVLGRTPAARCRAHAIPCSQAGDHVKGRNKNVDRGPRHMRSSGCRVPYVSERVQACASQLSPSPRFAGYFHPRLSTGRSHISAIPITYFSGNPVGPLVFPCLPNLCRPLVLMIKRI